MKILIFPNGPVVAARSRLHDHPDGYVEIHDRGGAANLSRQ